MVIKIGEFLKQNITLKSIEFYKWINDVQNKEECATEIIFALNTPGTGYRIADIIHKQLVGYKDYIDNDVCLSFDDNEIKIVVYNDAENIKFLNI